MHSFEALVTQALDQLPNEFQQKLNNVEVTIQDWPSSSQLQSVNARPNSTLFGLYQGVPLTKRGGLQLPDKITIFKGPILKASRSSEEVIRHVHRVVRHEIAHHFGMDETAIRRTGH